jgi:hypothetical protein
LFTGLRISSFAGPLESYLKLAEPGDKHVFAPLKCFLDNLKKAVHQLLGALAIQDFIVQLRKKELLTVLFAFAEMDFLHHAVDQFRLLESHHPASIKKPFRFSIVIAKRWHIQGGLSRDPKPCVLLFIHD